MASKRKNTVSKLYQSAIHCALLSAMARRRKCRMAEIQFFVDLFCGMMFLGSNKGAVASIQPVQIMRLLAELETEGRVVIEKKGAQTYYLIQPQGTLLLLQQMIDDQQRRQMSEILFINYFVTTYRTQLLSIAPNLASEADKEALRQILAPGRVVQRQLAALDEVIQQLQSRQKDYEKIQKFLEDESTQSLSTEEKIQRLPFGPGIPQTYKKSLRDALAELPPEVMAHEVVSGFKQRSQYFYAPYLEVLLEERRILVRLLPAQGSTNAA